MEENLKRAYEFVKSEFKSKPVTADQLEQLKDIYQNEIASSRRISCIETIDDLLEVLESRDIINENNTEPFKIMSEVIADGYNGENFNVSSSSPPKKSNNQINHYALERLRDEIEEQLRIASNQNHRLGNRLHFENNGSHSARIPSPNIYNNPVSSQQFTGAKKAAVYKLIATEIGRKWRDFGRGLNLREGEMDMLEVKHPKDLKTQVYKMFELFEEYGREDPRRHVVAICNALESCRRRDLVKEVQKILTN